MTRPEDISSANNERLKITHEDGTPTLGSFLVALRKQYAQRYQDQLLPTKIAAISVAEALSKEEYGMTSGSLSLLEQSKTLPRSPRRLISALGKIFELNSGEMWTLVQSYRYDRDTQIFGEQVANRFRPLGLTDAYNALLRGERLPEVEDPQIRQAMESLKEESATDRDRRYSSTQEA